MSWRAGAVGGRLAVALALALPLPVLAFAAAPALAASVTYYASPSGTGTCSTAATACQLTTALTDAASASGDSVTVQLAAGTYGPAAFTIDSGTEDSLTLQGAGADGTVLTGGGTDQTLSVSPGLGVAVTLADLTLEDGSTTDYGGNLWVGVVQSLDLVSDTVADGAAEDGGGGIEVDDGDTVSITDSTISGNDVGLQLQEGSPVVTIERSTFDDNTGGANSAAIQIDSGASGASVTIDDSTIADNRSIAMLSNVNGTTAIYGSTITDNEDGGIELNNGSDTAATVDLGADLLTDNDATDCYARSGSVADHFDDYGYNFADDTTCGLTATSSHQGASEAGSLALTALAANGGPTQTIRIPASSAAYDVVPTAVTLSGQSAAFCSGTDQRGVARTQAGTSKCDAGAYQVAPPGLSGVTPASAEVGQSLTLTGTNLSLVTAATFGAADTPAIITTQSADSLTVTVPSLSPGSQEITVVNPDGSTQIPFTVITPSSAGTGTPTVKPPALTLVKQSHSRWREPHVRAKAPTGTSFSFTLSEAARVHLTFYLHRRGRLLERGSLSEQERAGRHKLAFDGRLSRSRTLAPGSYTVKIVADSSAGESSAVRQLRFTIVG